MILQVSVTDPEVIAEIKSWDDGGRYTLTVDQDAALKFTGVDAGEAPEELEAEAAEEAPEKEASSEMAKKTPGIALLISKPAK